MAKNNEYHIYVHIDGVEDSDKSAMAKTASGSTGGSSAEKSEASDFAVKAAKRIVSYATIKSTADNIISHNISQVSLETGATEYEQKLSYAHSIASQVVGVGAALVMGGMSGGPAGFALAAVGIAVSGINKIINIEQRRETLRTERNLENISIGMQNVRAGTAGRRNANQ